MGDAIKVGYALVLNLILGFGWREKGLESKFIRFSKVYIFLVCICFGARKKVNFQRCRPKKLKGTARVSLWPRS